MGRNCNTTGRNCITVLWTCLTVLFTAAIVLTMISPVWFESIVLAEENTPEDAQEGITTTPVYYDYELVSFGLIRYCSRYDLSDIMKNCRFFRSFNEIPSVGWMVSTIMYALGLVCFAISLTLALVILCASEELGERLKIVAAYIQAIGVGFLAISLLMFPIGLDSQFAREVCGLEASMYMANGCQVAWGYVLGIMAVALTLFCPVLAKYSTKVNSEEDDEFEYKSECISLTTNSSSKVMTTV